MDNKAISDKVNKNITEILNDENDVKIAARKVLDDKIKEHADIKQKFNEIDTELDILLGELYKNNLVSIAHIAHSLGVSRQTIHKRLMLLFGVSSLKDVELPKNKK